MIDVWLNQYCKNMAVSYHPLRNLGFGFGSGLYGLRLWFRLMVYGFGSGKLSCFGSGLVPDFGS